MVKNCKSIFLLQPESLFNYPQKIDIFLRNNKISKISFSQEFSQNKKSLLNKENCIYLEDNPIQCNCEFSNLLEYMEKIKINDANLFTFDNFTCYFPNSSSQNRTLIKVDDLNYSNYTCDIQFSKSTVNSVCEKNGICDCKN